MATALLLIALVAPVALFWLLRAKSHLRVVLAAGLAVAVGWALNLAWAATAGESPAIASAFGWICPSVLVLITWLFLRRAKRQAA